VGKTAFGRNDNYHFSGGIKKRDPEKRARKRGQTLLGRNDCSYTKGILSIISGRQTRYKHSRCRKNF
jgi:hypothetical protein